MFFRLFLSLFLLPLCVCLCSYGWAFMSLEFTRWHEHKRFSCFFFYIFHFFFVYWILHLHSSLSHFLKLLLSIHYCFVSPFIYLAIKKTISVVPCCVYIYFFLLSHSTFFYVKKTQREMRVIWKHMTFSNKLYANVATLTFDNIRRAMEATHTCVWKHVAWNIGCFLSSVSPVLVFLLPSLLLLCVNFFFCSFFGLFFHVPVKLWKKKFSVLFRAYRFFFFIHRCCCVGFFVVGMFSTFLHTKSNTQTHTHAL